MWLARASVCNKDLLPHVSEIVFELQIAAYGHEEQVQKLATIVSTSTDWNNFQWI